MIEESRRVERGPLPQSADLPSLFSMLFDQLADSVYVTDDQGTILYVNHAFERITGYSSEEAVGQTPRILKSGIHPREVYEELWATIQAGTPFRFIFGNRTKDGEIYEEGVMISPIRDAAGRTTHYLSMGRVINAFRQNYDVFTLLANTAPAAIYLQRDGRVFFVNQHLTATLGYAPDELIGKDWLDLVLPEDRAEAAEAAAAMLDEGKDSAPFEYRVLTRDGKVRWLMATVRRVVFRGIQAVAGDFVAGYLTDITDRKDVEARLQRALSLYAATIDSTTDGIVVLDNERRLVSYNRLFTEMWGLGDLDPAEFTSRAVLAERMKDAEYFKRTVEEAWAEPTAEKGGTVELLDGRFMEFYSKPQVVDGRVIGRVWSWRDVTERRRFESTLIRLANYDSVTGLYSRSKFQEEVRRSLSADPKASAALLLLDLDGFKNVNDTYGHQAGDQVLIQVGLVLAGAGCGEIIGRFGGDEFAIFLPGHTLEEAAGAAQKAIEAISRRPYMAAGAEVSLTASAGVAAYPEGGSNADELLSAADLAMYEAKDTGRGRVHRYTPRLRQRSRLNLRGDWQARMRHAVTHRRGRLYAEEAVALRAKARGFHKLSIRMEGVTGGQSGDEFVSLVQQSGLSLLLDRWLLDEALGLARGLSALGIESGLAVDLNPSSLTDAHIVSRLVALGRTWPHGTAPLLLGFQAPAPTPVSSVIWRRLRQAGFTAAVGASGAAMPLELLQALPIGAVELEGVVVRKMVKDETARLVTRGVIALARRIGAQAVAGGVTNSATLLELQAAGVDCARGSHLARRRPAVALLKQAAPIAA